MARNVLIRLSLMVMGLVVGLLLAELTVRVAGLAPEISGLSEGRYRLSRNRAIGYEPIPGFAFESAEKQGQREVPTNIDDEIRRTEQWQDAWDINQASFDYRGKANRLGYRDRDHDVVKAAGVYRVVVLGDSIAAGLFISAYENTFPALLEVRLREHGVNAEVINFGVNGYNTQQEVETLKDRGLQFSPDLVLLAYCFNDRKMSGNNMLLRLLEKEQGRTWPSETTSDWLAHKSHLYRRLWYAPSLNDKGELPAEYESLRSDTVEKYFAELGRLQEEHGFQTLVASFPFLRNLDKPYPQKLREDRLAVSRWSKQYGLHHIDLLPTFRKCALETGERVFVDALHPTVTGHRCVAETAADYIAEVLTPRQPVSQDHE